MSFQLLAVDAAGVQAVYSEYAFDVTEPPKLRFAHAYQGWSPTSSGAMNETHGYRSVFVAASEADSSVSCVLP